MFRVKNISVTFSHHTLLDDFSCDFPTGQLCMILGPNGAGKTTLLKCLDGEITPSPGVVELNGQPLSRWSNLELATQRAVLPQYSNLDFPFTVRDVVLMGRIPHDTTEDENQKIADDVLAHCDCVHLAARAFPTLSGGEQQRVHTARILAQIWNQSNDKNRFLLLDEPVSALDLSHQYSLLTLLKQLAKDQQIGIICSLHNLNLAAQFADRCLLIDNGQLIADGAPKDVFSEDILSKVFSIEMWVNPHPQNPDIPLIMPKLDENTVS
ncbi:MAG: heme ABC transporter ATP-binding protein [Gammaproteobacteria bacterium]|nr:heme ABC transporter ATP-binding protein [Gammaproteobacteria bacterium]